MKKRIWALLTSLILALPLFASLFVASGQVFATTTDTVNVTIHKRVFDQGTVPANKQNTGDTMSDFGGTPLAGVTFTAYDVTDQYLSYRSDGAGMTAEAAIQKIQNDAAMTAPAYAAKIADGVTTNPDGTYIFTNLALKNGDKDKVYLFVETNSPSNIIAKAAPIVLAMPIFKGSSNTDINKDIHVYPKNEQATAITKDLDDASKTKLEVTLPDGSKIYNASFGQTFGYEVVVAVPWNIQSKDTFNVIDNPDKGIDIDASTVTVAGLTKGSDYTVQANQVAGHGAGYKITFNTQSAGVIANAGKLLTISYQAVLTNDAVADTAINNTATLTIGNGTDLTTTPTDGPNIYTGGAKFIKQDKQSSAALAGAKFVLVTLDSNGNVAQYASQDANGKYTWSNDASTATTYTSGANGGFTLEGLNYSSTLENGGSYAVVETQAPDGYALLTDPLKFTITKGSFSDNSIIHVLDIKKGVLPATGGTGIYLFLIAGSLLMSGAYVWNKRNKRNSEI